MNIFEIKTVEIEEWTEKEPRRAQELLPKLILKLIYATSQKIIRCDFPYEKAIQYSGYDGELDVEEETKFYQKGKSVWEIGTNKDIKKKFQDDIKKRSEASTKNKMSKTEFIFVTSRIWNHTISKEKIIEETLKKYKWKNIRIYDAHTIEQWLLETPAVLAWFIDIIGKKINGLISVERYWEKTGKETTPEFKTDFLLLGREKEVTELGEWIENNISSIFIIGDSLLESALFIASFLLESKNKKILNKTIIVENENAWNKVVNETFCNNILIPVFNFNNGSNWSSNLKILFPISRFSALNKIKNESIIKLNKMKQDNFMRILELLGYEYHEAKKIRYETKGLFPPLYRKITNNPLIKNPLWIEDTNSKKLISLMLVTGFDKSKIGDKAMIEKISNENIMKYIESISDYFKNEDSPILKYKDMYTVVSIEEIWNNLFDLITEEDIKNFKEIVITIFKSKDPKFELSADKWWIARYFVKEMEYSYNIMQGVIISLAMLKEKDKEENNFKIFSTKKFVDEIFIEIFSSVKEWQHWYTIVPFVPLMSEISSDIILEILEDNIDNLQSEFWKLFEITEDTLTSKNYYTYILWTLEAHVWFRKDIKKAIILLIKIAEQDIEYKNYGNTPLNSLVDIFCIWKPQCSLKAIERNELLRQIVTDYPKTGWELLERLLSTSVTTAIARPIWNEIEEIEEKLVDENINESLKNVISICLGSKLSNYKLWEVVISNIEKFGEYYILLITKIETEIENLNFIEREKLCQKLRQKIYVEMKFKKKRASEIEKILEKIEDFLFDDILKYKYLFQIEVYIKDEILLEKNFNYEEEKKYIFELRKQEFLKIKDSYELDEILEFIKTIEYTGDLEILFVEIIFEKKYDFELLKRIKNSNIKLYYNILYKLSYYFIGADILSILEERTLEEKIEILKYSTANMDLWEQIETLESEIQDCYWGNIDIPFEFLKKEEEKSFYIEKLIKYCRPYTAIRIIAYNSYNDVEKLIEILELLIIEEDSISTIEKSKMERLNGSYIKKIFEKIYRERNLNEEIMINLELSYLDFFSKDFSPIFLVNYLKKEPMAYVELIKKSNEENKRIQLFLSQIFKEVPGCDIEEENKEKFEAWIRIATESAERFNIDIKFKKYLGNLLSRIPVGEDGIYPHKFVREYLEKNKSKEIKQGFINGNTNGIIYDSTMEKNMINKYREDAEKLLTFYPTTASILTKLADDYENFRIMSNEEEENINYLF